MNPTWREEINGWKHLMVIPAPTSAHLSAGCIGRLNRRSPNVTPRELIDELERVLKVHPEAENHTMFAESMDGNYRAFQIHDIRYDKRRKRIILE